MTAAPGGAVISTPGEAAIGRLLVIAVFAAFVVTEIVALLSNTTLDGESAILKQVAIEYAREGKWHYPIHARQAAIDLVGTDRDRQRLGELVQDFAGAVAASVVTTTIRNCPPRASSVCTSLPKRMGSDASSL